MGVIFRGAGRLQLPLKPTGTAGYVDAQDTPKMRSRLAPNQTPVIEGLLTLCCQTLNKRQRKGFYWELNSHLEKKQRRVSHIAASCDFTASLQIFYIFLKALPS